MHVTANPEATVPTALDSLELLDWARQEIEAQRYSAALEALDRLIREGRPPDAHRLKVSALRLAKRFGDAEGAIAAARRALGAHAELDEEVGRLRWDQGRVADCVDAFLRSGSDRLEAFIAETSPTDVGSVDEFLYGELLDAAVDAAPHSTELLRRRGGLHLNRDEFEAAVDDYQRAGLIGELLSAVEDRPPWSPVPRNPLELFDVLAGRLPFDAQVWTLSARAAIEHREYDRALDATERLTALAPDQDGTRALRIRALRGAGRADEAATMARDALRLPTVADELLAEACLTLFLAGQVEELSAGLDQRGAAATTAALSGLVDAHQWDPSGVPSPEGLLASTAGRATDPGPILLAASFAHSLGRLEEELAWLERAGEAGDAGWALAGQLSVLRTLRRFGDAERVATQAVATRPVPEAVRAQCAALQLDLEHGERAVEVLADLTDPEDLENTLIDVLGERAERGPEGPHDPVLEDALRAALERRPASEPLWAELSVQLARREAWDEAIDARMECSGNDALARWILDLRNPWYLSPGHTLGPASARQLAKLAAARLGSDPRVRHEAGSLLLEAGWVDEALDILSEGGAGAVEDAVNDVARSEEILLAASERYPESVNLRLALAESALDTGRFEDAAKTFAAIVALAPGLAHARAGEIDALRRQAQHEQAEGDEAAADIWLGEAEARLRKLPEDIASEREIIAAAAAVDICRGGHVEGVRALVDLGRVDLALELMRDGGRPGPAQLAIARAMLELRPDDTDLRAETGWFLMGADVPLSGNPVAALRAFEAALATKRFDTVALEGRVHALRQLGQAEAARTAVDEALARRPDAPELIWLAAQLDSDAGNSAGALRRLEAIPADDRPDYVITGRLQALRSLRRLDQAEDEFRSALERNVRSSRLLNEAGWLAIAQGNNTVAIERFDEAYELAPTGWSERRDALFSQAVGLDSAHCYQRAQKAYKQLAQLDPSNPYPHHNLAAIYWNLGSYERARQSWQEADVRYAKGAKCAEEACAADYFSNWAMITRGVDGSFDVPVELYRKSLKLRPDQPYIAAVLASVYSDWARTGEAQPEGPTPDGAHVRTRGERFWRAWEYRDEAKRQLDRRPDFKTDFDARLKLADLSTNFEEFAEADELHDGAEELARNRLETASLLASRGVLAMRREEYPAAVRAFRQASRAEPENLEVRSNLAEALLKSGDTDSAREAYSAVLEIAPDHVEARIGLGHVFTELGESTKDESLLNRAVQSLGEALKSSASERGSKRLTDKDRAAVYYACGYARVAQLKLSGPLADRSLLKDALEDFAECTRLDKHHYKAIRAVRAIEEQRKPLSNQRLAERAGPLLVAGAALVVFLLVQASLIFGWPIGDLAPGTYGALSLGALLFVVAGLYLPNVTGLKVGTIQLEKSVVEQVSVSTDLGISK